MEPSLRQQGVVEYLITVLNYNGVKALREEIGKSLKLEFDYGKAQGKAEAENLARALQVLGCSQR